MPALTVTDFLATLRSFHILEPAQLDKLASLQAKIPDPQVLAKKLIAQGWLTPYQANALLQGRGQALVLDAYVLIDRIGEGGMGEVYKAKNWKMGRIVALKVIRKERLKSDNAVRRFYREVQTSAKLSHQNIVRAFDAGQDGKIHFFAMEYIEGIDLTRLVKQSGPLPVPQACEFMRQAALGLQHAHEKGMVHRDIKPSNLLVAKADSSVKLLDMGLARMDDHDESVSTLTQEGSVLGTLDYLSPEQAFNAHKADIRSDLYSLGCTFYYLLTGQVPFAGGSATEKLLKHRLEEPMALEQLRPGLPAQVAAVVRKLMAKNPDERFQTPAEVAAALGGGPGQIKPGPLPAKITGGRATPLDSMPTLGGDGITLRTAVQAASKGRRKLLWVAGIGGAALVLLLGMCLVTAALLPNSSDSSSTAVVKGTGKTTGKPTQAAPRYVKMGTREETILATLKASGVPNLEGKWHVIGYFDAGFGKGHEAAYPPEKEIELSKSYVGKNDQMVSWKETRFVVGRSNVFNNLMQYPLINLGATTYLYHEFEAPEALDLPMTFGGTDTLIVRLNGEESFSRVAMGEFKPEQHSTSLRLKPGKNQLLLKSCNAFSKNIVYICPQLPAKLAAEFGASLKKDFPN